MVFFLFFKNLVALKHLFNCQYFATGEPLGHSYETGNYSSLSKITFNNIDEKHIINFMGFSLVFLYSAFCSFAQWARYGRPKLKSPKSQKAETIEPKKLKG